MSRQQNRLSGDRRVESKERLEQLCDRRWNRWWGYNWRRKRDLTVRNQRLLENRRRFLHRLNTESYEECDGPKRASIYGHDDDDDLDSACDFRYKLARLLSAFRSRIGCVRQSIARHFQRSRSSRQTAVSKKRGDRCRPEPFDSGAVNAAVVSLQRRRLIRCQPDKSLHALERLSQELERLRAAESASVGHDSVESPLRRPMGGGDGTDVCVLTMERLSRRFQELCAGDRPPLDRPLYIADAEWKPGGAGLPRYQSWSLAGEWRGALYGSNQVCPAVTSMHAMDSGSAFRGETKQDRSELNTYEYLHWASAYRSPAAGWGDEAQLLSTVATQTEPGLKTSEVSPITTSQAEDRPHTRSIQTQTVDPRRDATTQWASLGEPSRETSEVPSTSCWQQTPAGSDVCLIAAQKAKDDETRPQLCGSIVKADFMKSVFGSKTHFVICRPRFAGCEDSKVIKLAAMEMILSETVSCDKANLPITMISDKAILPKAVTSERGILPNAVSYDRYYAELSSDSKSSSNRKPRTPRENVRLSVSVTPFMEVTFIDDDDNDDNIDRKECWNEKDWEE